MTLYEANEDHREQRADGRKHQYTILDVPALLTETAFRRAVVDKTADPMIREWWARWDYLDRRLQMEIINPVQTKIARFAGSEAARAIVGQACSTVDPAAWLRDGKIVVVNTAKGVVGEDTAALVGGTLLNLVALVVGEQAALPAHERRPVTLLVDEFQCMPGADYETVLAELPKYGANLVLSTQGLARLEALDREHGRGLRSTLFANLDGLFAFHVSAEDARYLVPELGEGLDEHDLVALGEHRCYARLSTGGERPPAFSVELDPPPPSDRALMARLAAASAARYGRDLEDVEDELTAAIQRVANFRGTPPAAPSGEVAEPGVAGDRATEDAAAKRRRRLRSRRRRASQAPDGARQEPLPEPPAEPLPDDRPVAWEDGDDDGRVPL